MTEPASVMADMLRAAPPSGRILFAGDSAAAVMTGFEGALWTRTAAPWPPEGDFAAAVLDLPLAREAYRMAIHAIAARLGPGAPLFVYGANDAGIKSAARVLDPFFERVEAVAARAHARVWRALRNTCSDGLLPRLADWRQVSRIDIAGRAHDWVSYPGVFARGGLDAGTALLLAHLPDAAGLDVLDFGAGTGVIARALIDRGAKASLVEPDALARAAALENVPDGAMFAEGMPAGRFHLIVSNPPIHRGKAMDFSVVTQLLKDAPQHLKRGGALLLVTQKTVPVPRFAAPAPMQLLADESGYRVWRLAV